MSDSNWQSQCLAQPQNPDIEELARKGHAALLSSLTEAVAAGVAHNGWNNAQIESTASALLSELLKRGFFVLSPAMITEFMAKADVPVNLSGIELLVHDFLAQIANRIAHSREVRITRVSDTELQLSTAFVVL